METANSNMIQYFANLSVGAKIFWIILAVIFIFSIYVAITQKAKAGGIAAGVITGIAIYASVILQNKSLMKWVSLFHYQEWYIVVAVIAGFFVSLFLFLFLGAGSFAAADNKSSFIKFLAVLLRIFSAAGLAVTFLFVFALIRNGGVIYF